jgi:exopolyphosphatase/guanosine-5'-triphosphate,3'-diphosphate pyrophosphatase
MRIAAIDIGTNSTHMIIMQIRPDQSFEVVDREKQMVRLSSGGLGTDHPQTAHPVVSPTSR